MNKVISFFVFSMLLLTLNLAIPAQKQTKTQITKASTEFASTEAFSDGNGVWLNWQMQVENNNLGFNIYRINGSNREIVNPYLIGGGFLQNNEKTTLGGTYTFFDPKGSLETIYVIETLAINGQKVSSTPFSVKYTSDLAGISGKTSELFNDEAKTRSYRIEKNEISLNEELYNEIAANALQPDLTKQRFVTAQTAVKFGVKKEGIYRVSRTELENSGFDVNSPKENWQLFKNGNEQAIIVENSGQYIEFYGQGIDTVESETQIYYLINGTQPGKRIGTTVRRPIGGNVVSNSYDQSFYKADRVLYISSIRNGDGNNFFSGNVVNTTGTTVTFNLDGINRNITESVITVGVQGLTTTPHNVNVTFNGTALEPLAGNNYDLMTKTYRIPTSLLIEGANNLFLNVPSSTSDVSLAESVKVNYARAYLAKQNTLSFYATNSKKFEVKGFTNQNIKVFDTTYPDSPTVINNLAQTQENGTFGISIPANRAKKMFAATDDAVLQVDTIEQNTPSTLATAEHNANLIIITHKNWLNEAQVWRIIVE